MLLYYVNIERQKICGRNNNIIAPICIDFSVITPIKFQFINSQNQIVRLDDTNGLYLAGSLKMGEQPYNLLFLSKDYTVDESGAVTFMLDTCTVPYCEKIKKKNTEINIEIGQVALNDKRVICRDYALANPRVYSPSLAPAQIESADYWTKEETQEAIDLAVSGIQISGYVTTEELEEGLATKQNAITEDEKLDYALISGAPTIPTKTSDLDNDSDYVDSQYVTDATSAFITEDALQGLATEQYVDSAVSGKADKAEIPLSTSQLENDSGYITDSALAGLASEQYVDAAVSGKADKSELADYQEKITSDAKLAYDLLSGTPTIPSKTSDLQNDSNFVTSAYVQAEVSGKADKAEIPLSTSQLANDSGFITDADLNGYATEDYVQAEVSGKQDIITVDNWLSAECVRTELDPWSGDPEYTVDAAINIVHREALDAKEGLSGKADIADIPLSTSQLANDSGYATSAYVDEVAATKQDVITFDEWLSAGCVRTELDPWSGDPEYTVDAAINIVHQEALAAQAGLSGKADIADIPLSTSQLTNDSGYATSAYVDSQVSGKQDVIDDGNPLNAHNVVMEFTDWSGDPEFRVDDGMNSLHVLIQQNEAAITGKLDNPSGGTVGQVVKKTADGVEWADDAVINPTNTTFEKKNLGSDTAYKADFAGKQIQKYSINSAAREKIEIQLENAETIPNGSAPTIELQVPSFGAETIVLPSSVQLVDELPETLENASGKLTYHDIVFRAEKDERDAVKVYANYAYKFAENEVDYLYFETLVDDNILTFTVQNGNPTAPNLYYSYDKVNWNTVSLGTNIDLENAGDRVYFKGNNASINSVPGGGTEAVVDRVTFRSTGRVNMGGNLFTILNENGAPSGILYSCFNSFLRGMTSLVSVKNLVIPDIEYTDTSIAQTMTNVYYAMFRECTSLIDMPIMKQKYVYPQMFYAMFRGCTALSTAVIHPADTLCGNGYYQTFYGCSNLNDITVSFTDWNGPNGSGGTGIITNGWLTSVSSTGTFRCPSNLNTTTRDASYVPANWTVVNI